MDHWERISEISLRNMVAFIVFENVVCQVASILYMPHCVPLCVGCRLQKQLPAGRAFICMDTKNLPNILQQIFTSAMLTARWGTCRNTYFGNAHSQMRSLKKYLHLQCSQPDEEPAEIPTPVLPQCLQPHEEPTEIQPSQAIKQGCETQSTINSLRPSDAYMSVN